MARNHLATNCATSPPTTTTYTTVDPFGTGHGGDGVVSKPAAAYCLPPANNDILGYEQHDLAQHNYKPSSASSAAGSSYTTDDAIDLEKGYARREDRARHPRGSRRRELEVRQKEESYFPSRSTSDRSSMNSMPEEEQADVEEKALRVLVSLPEHKGHYRPSLLT